MKNISKKIKEFGITETIVFVLYILAIFVIGITHECFEDETQSWLIARDLNFIEIIQQMKYEGHGFIWYYILAPFAKLGFPIETQIYISSLFAIGTVYLILKKSPFNKLLKILLTFSSGMIYFYSAMARPYCMIPFLLACISVIYKNRQKYQYLYAILIGLLANTHLVMLPTSIMLLITFWGEELIFKRKLQTKESKIKLYKSLLVAILFITIYGLIILFALNNCKIINNFNRISSITKISELIDIIKNCMIRTVSYLYGEQNVPLYYKALVVYIMILCLISVKYNVKQGLIFWSQLLFTILIHALAWFIIATRVIIVIYTLMFWLWNDREDQQGQENHKRNIWIELALILLIIITIPSAYKLYWQDVTGNFSTGKMTASYINKNIPEGSCFICSEQELQQSVIAYLPKDKYQFYMPNSEKFVTYITWDEKWNTSILEKDIQKSIDLLKKQYEEIYILGGILNTDDISENYKHIFDTQGKLIQNFYVRNEIYSIYKVNI